ncbi:MAG: mechanosensitive ion channel [Bacilli bacterium]
MLLEGLGFWETIGQWFVDLWNNVVKFFVDVPAGGTMSAGQRLFLGIFTFIIGYIIIHYFFKFIKRVTHVNEIKTKRKIKAYNSKTKKIEEKYITENNTLKKFIINFLSFVVKLLLVLFVFNIMGFNLSGATTIISSALLAVGLALQDSIKNFVSGIMVLSNKSVFVGDFVEIPQEGIEGTVIEIKMLITIIDTPKGQRIFLPNNFLTSNSFKNYNSNKLRRADISFSVAYGQDVAAIKKLVLDLTRNDPRIIATPGNAASCTMGDFSTYSIKFTLKLWVKNEVYWDVFHEYNEKIATAMYKNNISPCLKTISIDSSTDAATSFSSVTPGESVDMNTVIKQDTLDTLTKENEALREELIKKEKEQKNDIQK